MIRTYKVMKNRLMAFQRFQRQKIEFSSLDFNFYESFVNYLTYDHTHMRRNISIRGLKRNSIGTSIKQLRIFVRDRVRRKIIASIDLTDFKILDEETDAIYLTPTEIDAIYKVDLSADPHKTPICLDHLSHLSPPLLYKRVPGRYAAGADHEDQRA